MSGTTDFVPFATATGANVTSQAAYLAEATTASGFNPGQASSADCNKAWRQGAFQAAVVANFTAATLNINVADDGNISVAITNFTAAVVAAAGNASNLSSGTLPTGRLPSSFSVSGTITAGAFNVSSDKFLKEDIKPIGGALGRLDLLRGVTFVWKKSGMRAAGVIAQDVVAAIQEGVSANEAGLLSVDPMAVVGVLIEALKEEKRARISLEHRLAAIEAR